MIQDLKPHTFLNEFRLQAPKDTDYLLIFNGAKVLMNSKDNKFSLTSVKQIKSLNQKTLKSAIYLFSLDDTAIFYTRETLEESDDFVYVSAMDLREKLPKDIVFIAATAGHLVSWYGTNKFCGRCSTEMQFSKTERAVCCPKCGLVKYPQISPAVIVGIIHNDKILLTRYSDRPYKKLSLVAGYIEIGETLEDTIKREVMEEVGLKVKNIKYYKSQPWAFSQSVLMGFFAQLDGDPTVTVDESELSEATWYSRDEIPECDTNLSLTNEMITVFKNGEVKDSRDIGKEEISVFVPNVN